MYIYFHLKTVFFTAVDYSSVLDRNVNTMHHAHAIHYDKMPMHNIQQYLTAVKKIIFS